MGVSSSQNTVSCTGLGLPCRHRRCYTGGVCLLESFIELLQKGCAQEVAPQVFQALQSVSARRHLTAPPGSLG